MVLPAPLFQLQCKVNEYEWGKVGRDSKAAKFALATKEASFDLREDNPYAELWMGTHPSGPSLALPSGTLLSDVLNDNSELCGHAVSDAYADGKLPFLFKVLSIRKALSIQCHPTKELAKDLHRRDPHNYKDDNHKPEMAIAITPFEGFCGFRPIPEIVSFLHHVEAFSALLGENAVRHFTEAVAHKEDSKDEKDVAANRAALKSLFSTLMNTDEKDVAHAAHTLIHDAKSSSSSSGAAAFAGSEFGGKVLADLLIRLDTQFPGDIGLFCTFFLNYVTLKPGESLFLRALDCHAYLSGDIMECMAASDNVVRAGFTPKFKDVTNLTEMLTYAYAPPADQTLVPVPWTRARHGDGEALLYDPPIEEFSVVQTKVPARKAHTHEAVNGPSIIIATTGNGTLSVGNSECDVKEGQVFFVGADAQLTLSAHDGEFVTYRAFVEIPKQDDNGGGDSVTKKHKM